MYNWNSPKFQEMQILFKFEIDLRTNINLDTGLESHIRPISCFVIGTHYFLYNRVTIGALFHLLTYYFIDYVDRLSITSGTLKL